MRIATKERYALKMMADLAVASDSEPVSLTAISTRQNISVGSLRVIAEALVLASLIEADSHRPYHYHLAQQPDRIRLQDIFRSTDGRFACLACNDARPDECRRYRVCSRVHFWEGLQEIDLPLHDANMSLKTLADYLTKRKTPLP
ncbi:Rrf2 family transcriptional regulator [Oxalobacter paraformigenes]|uniref:Rrf2 family protein n=1 Tax=Oxalobacter paraformigenes TaxID=556268 RepID=C3X3S1_9BURK|nr:Rrf2 family transcriptional regulator [Oxalobacter paraformigenes]EEO27857.1 Rrf2 family protein [Oxalobacter paraformigenes]